MANPNSPFGLRPVHHIIGAEYNGQTNRYYIDTAVTIFGIGDIVRLGGSGDSNGVPTVLRGTSGGAPIGVITSIEADRENQTRTVVAVGESAYVNVADSPDIIFEIQSDVDGVVADDLGLVGSLTVTDANTTTGKSNIVLDANGANNDFRIIRKKQISDNELGAYAVVEGLLAQHLYGSRNTTDI